ncbi:DUF2971 domain-containing protein [Burkholderia multivorans]|nr:DUF2971 domain-containing protein [Burkholderia multivorans]MBU9146104.1 DUF2971 domain-containing protein [Burkholderia multivorans]HEF4772999.1 DUF2971 domain-containing protein [Burkholderia multivorans]
MSGNLISHRFRPIHKFTLGELVNEEIYFCSPSKFNDPFDCRIDVRKVLEQHAVDQKAIAVVEKIVQNVGVVCFSYDLRNTLMWSHYAQNHEGLCITYEIPSRHIIDNQDRILGWSPVRYKAQEIERLLVENKDEPEQLITILLSSKSESWEYEQEFRVVSREPGVQKIEREWIRQICFGLNTKDENIKLVRNIAQEKYPQAAICKMERDGRSLFSYQAVVI